MPSYVESVDLALAAKQLHVLSSTGYSQEGNGGVVSFTFQQPVLPDNDQIITRVALEKATIPVVAKNITSSNCTLEFTITYSGSTTSYSVNLSKGYYNATQLVTLVNTGFTALSPTGGVTLSYNVYTNRFNIATAGVNYTLVTTNTSGASIWSFLQIAIGSSGYSINSTQGFNVQPTTNYWIAISTFPNQVETSHNLFPAVVARVPVNQTYLGILQYEPVDLFWLDARSLNFTNITVSIYDDAGKVVDMDNQTWCMTFYVDFAYLKKQDPGPDDAIHNFISRDNPALADPLMRRRDFDRLLKRGRQLN